jgi:uncharacterized protein YqjF (DUF2071 family)
MTESWNDLLFAHWCVDVSEVRRAVSATFDLDLLKVYDSRVMIRPDRHARPY